ncbi:N-acetylgalactosaminide beta-1,3-galactosyltransferase [Caenorhabditis elegans]|uniref:N-acetylgalactosaminide beta-1,3-galactosyltransferase n=1 Tax=Caenorhabditis elegans TaxID=6239 RepID=Q22900_CAEEL|nr:N-acetylgalactosaminide beta-1,3-galactosyltransferase [Caenorhabditis elegans]CCD64740.1 N-acetylgalactosaminide beta-1,3-galactosyltransferase [Caenorhabditis elegans]|eukprot:NP_505126.2 Glycoprotein-N-acetylgalactosamine 3-beta-galactosyltransferase 1 [Caenorhabditis elegans]
MVQCGNIRTLICNSEEDYNIYDDEFDSLGSLKKPRNKKLFISTIALAFLILAAILITIFLLTRNNSPRATYDRKNDSKLLDLIEVSPAAQRLPKKGKLFCWVQTSTIYHDTRSLAINETWIHRCDHGQLFTSERFNDTRIPYSTVFKGIPDDYYNLFFKSRYAFHHIYTNISSEFDWYLKADDDTFVIVENLRSFLSTLNPDEPHYLGYVLKPYLKNGYNAGGAGYILSRAALKIFSEQLYSNATLCPDDIYEDVGIARCLANAGMYPEDTRNSLGQNRFNTFSPSDTFHQTKAGIDWVKFKENKGYEAFANDLISFHKLSPDEIRLFDILLYRTNRKNE